MNTPYFDAKAYPNRAMAEVWLADAWAKSARAEGHVKKHPVNSPPGKAATPRSGAVKAIRQFAKSIKGSFTIHDLCRTMPEFKREQLSSAAANAVEQGYIAKIGKSAHGVNIYIYRRVVSA